MKKIWQIAVIMILAIWAMWADVASGASFRHELKPAPPTIVITFPAAGDILSMQEMTIKWTPVGDAKRHFLGFILVNELTGERTFFGDAFSIKGKSVQRPVGGIEPGKYRVEGYHYGLNDDWTSAGVSEIFTLSPTASKTFWTTWAEAEKLCGYFANTENYILYDIKEIECSTGRCVYPKFYILASPSWALLEDRSSHLPEDKTLIRIRCVPYKDIFIL